MSKKSSKHAVALPWRKPPQKSHKKAKLGLASAVVAVMAAIFTRKKS